MNKAFFLIALAISLNASAAMDFNKVRNMFKEGSSLSSPQILNEIQGRVWNGRCYQPDSVNEKLGSILYIRKNKSYELLTVVSNYENYLDSMTRFELLDKYEDSFSELNLESDLNISHNSGNRTIYRGSGEYLVSKYRNFTGNLRYCIYFER
ncbi:hypothetical protein [Halobacteriovorax sp. ZH4_bin.1]|uniref:hypothetical protein n=1 Tax=unclassified Halobacteriovorax TaxID=2639665 RepID=UPI0037173119